MENGELSSEYQEKSVVIADLFRNRLKTTKRTTFLKRGTFFYIGGGFF